MKQIYQPLLILWLVQGLKELNHVFILQIILDRSKTILSRWSLFLPFEIRASMLFQWVKFCALMKRWFHIKEHKHFYLSILMHSIHIHVMITLGSLSIYPGITIRRVITQTFIYLLRNMDSFEVHWNSKISLVYNKKTVYQQIYKSLCNNPSNCNFIMILLLFKERFFQYRVSIGRCLTDWSNNLLYEYFSV